MANKRIRCSGCRRFFDQTIEYCPHCGTKNLVKQLSPNTDAEDIGEVIKRAPVRPDVKKKSNNAFPDSIQEQSSFHKSFSSDVTDPFEDAGIEESLNRSADFYEDVEDDEEYEYEKIIEYDDDAEYEDDEYIPDDDSKYPDEVYYEDVEFNDTELTADEKRSKINWTDEEESPDPDMSNAFDNRGIYMPNHDNYYNDREAEIADELENLRSGKEKVIIKIFGGMAAMAGIVLYLVATLNI